MENDAPRKSLRDRVQEIFDSFASEVNDCASTFLSGLEVDEERVLEKIASLSVEYRGRLGRVFEEFISELDEAFERMKKK